MMDIKDLKKAGLLPLLNNLSLRWLLVFCGACYMVSYVFLRNPIFACIGIPVGFMMERVTAKDRMKKKMREQLIDFRQFIDLMNGSMKSVGKAPELCLDEAVENMGKMHMERQEVYKNILIMHNNLHTSYQTSLPKELMAMAERLNNPDIKNFASSVAMCYGINNQGISDVIKSSSTLIMEKIQIEDEIQTAIKPQLSEFYIMLLVPSFMMIMIGGLMPGFFDDMYASLTGMIIMSIGLAANLSTFFIAKSIIKKGC